MTKNHSIIKTLKSKKGEAYIDTAFKILIAIVIGALLFTTIYTLFNQTILTQLTEKVNTIFATGTSLTLPVSNSTNVQAASLQTYQNALLAA